MSGYPPYGYPGGGDGYPPSYPMGNPGYPPNNNFQPPPPPVPYYGQPPSNFYGYDASGANYQAPPQQYEGYNNPQYQTPYVQANPSENLYPNLLAQASYPASTPAASSYPPPQFQNQPYYPAQQQQQQQPIIPTSLENYQGTIFPIPNFNPDTDCQTLGQAMKGIGTNEKALIDIITNRSNQQRQQIKTLYKTMYGTNLMNQIASETSGHFRDVLTALFETPENFDAWSLQQAFVAGRDGTVSEILLARTNSEIRLIADAYRRTYNRDLENQINSRIRGTDLRRLLVSTVQANRDELSPQQIQKAQQMGIESIIDRNRARQDAEALYKAGAGKIGTDEKTFNAIFSQRSYHQLRATFEEYQNKYHKDIAKVIKSEFSGDIEDAYLILIAVIRDRPAFFAERIHKAIAGLGTNDTALIRVIVSRSEIDLAQIKQRYQQMYNHSLTQDVGGDTSGDYKRILLAIIK